MLVIKVVLTPARYKHFTFYKLSEGSHL